MEILRHFPSVDAHDVECLGNAGGFSGACLWKIGTPAGRLCLRKWPQAHPTEDVLRHIHGLLLHAASNGMSELPIPLLNERGDSIVRQRGTLFELSPWMPGQANYHTSPSAQRLSSAMTTLARFHTAMRTHPHHGEQSGAGCSPGIAQRHDKLERLLHGELNRLATAVADSPDPEIRQRGRRLLEFFPRSSSRVLQLLDRALPLQVTLQPCIRDIWHDHVLFTGDKVTGLIDFGAMRYDNVACDLARLIGSLVGDRKADWSAALQAYTTERPLTADENLLIHAFDQSSVLMSGLSWLQWICVDGRQFDNQRQVLRRLDENLRRMEHLCGSA